ncbi:MULTISPECIES: hypothetical protein [Arthrobacter]|nr:MULTISPECIES: hypothetical protein [Arthrobacter]
MAAAIMGVGIWIFVSGAPGWIFLAVVSADAVVDFFLVNSWVKADAVSDLHRPATHPATNSASTPTPSMSAE